LALAAARDAMLRSPDSDMAEAEQEEDKRRDRMDEEQKRVKAKQCVNG